MLVCQQMGSSSRWTVDLPGGSVVSNSASSSQAGRVLTFADDPGFEFEIHVLFSNASSSNMFISELRVTAVRQLNGATVECAGVGYFTLTILILGEALPFVN